MNEHQPITQRWLFESDRPAWNSLQSNTQQALLDVLSQMFSEALQKRQAPQHDDDSNNQPNHEDPHVA